MPKIYYTAQDYKGDYVGKNTLNENFIFCNKLDLCRASITVGNPRYFIWNEVKTYGLFRAFASLILENWLLVNINIKSKKDNICLHQIYDSYVSDRKRNISYNLGMAIAKLYSERILGIPNLIHVESLKRIKAITFKKTIKKPDKKSSRSREPDLVGKDKDGLWHIFEAKGTISDSLDGKVNDAKIQANQVVTICGQKPSTRSVCVTYLGHDKIFSQIKDPENDEKKEIDINMEKYYNYYYFPFVALKEYMHSESYRSTINNLYYDSLDIYIKNKKLSIGLDSEIAALLQEKRYGQITECLKKRQNTEFYFTYDDHVSIGLDGFMIKDNKRQDR